MGNCDGTLKNTNTLRILAGDGVDFLCLPQRIPRGERDLESTELLEPNFKRGIENRDGLLTGMLSHRREMGLVLGGNELDYPREILPKEIFDERTRQIKGGERLEDRFLREKSTHQFW
jgi:hypothetical protein